MRIIQQQPSTSGYTKKNIIENVISVWPGKGVINGIEQDVIHCQLPLNKTYCIGYFPSVLERDRCVQHIFNNRKCETLELRMKEFFVTNYLTPELIRWMLAEYTLSKYFINLFTTFYSDKTDIQLMDMDAFNVYSKSELLQLKRGKINEVEPEILDLWAITLPTASKLRNCGLNKFQFFNYLYEKHTINLIRVSNNYRILRT